MKQATDIEHGGTRASSVERDMSEKTETGEKSEPRGGELCRERHGGDDSDRNRDKGRERDGEGFSCTTTSA